ncbi:N-6 DNA methylase [Amycolatopsis anabasis]|uniref:N-6 DNA methylase n=1 Tax=Amycolatopsis anabasis TaxID=1840409 RepID=UPI001C55162C|nr:N-6 DNA methylase [Amycolatopsis anabasis]
MSTFEAAVDSPALRKARGAFFTPSALCDYIVDWAVRTPADQVLEPACGEAAFLLSAGARLDRLGEADGVTPGPLRGVELHAASARHAAAVVEQAGHRVQVDVGDFFEFDPRPAYDVVVGNPPYVRYQDFSGEARSRSRQAALRAGVPLTGLASSWAAFTVHAALFLKPGGRLGLVLPAELLTVNYAAPVRRFLLERFKSVRLVLFTERVFPGVLEEVVLVLADGFDQGSTKHCDLYQARNTTDLHQAVGRRWEPADPDAKWTPSLLTTAAVASYETLAGSDAFTTLHAWGETTLGMVTGNNRYFTLSPARAEELGLADGELLPMSPPGSRHLRGLAFTKSAWRELGEEGKATYLLRPPEEPSAAARAYFAAGERDKVDQAYKCRVRKPWWRVPLVDKPDLFLTYMNADTARLCANRAGVHNLNSVHGVYLHPGLRTLGTDLLPIASLNSMTLLGAETVGRAYGGGMLKIEPKEADRLPVPSKELLAEAGAALRKVRPKVTRLLRAGKLLEAVRAVDDVLLVAHTELDRGQVRALREAHSELHARRVSRGRAT